MFQNHEKRAARRGWPIQGYVGPNGSGKTAAMVWDSLPSLESGRSVLSTVRLLDYQNPRPCEGWRGPADAQVPCELCVTGGDRMRCAYPLVPDLVTLHPGHMQAHPLWVPFTEWEQLLNARRVDVLMDEVTGVASSRESHSMPAPVANALVQMRRADVVIRWSAPSWARADKIIRECSQAVTHARGFLPVSSSDGTRMWRNRRLFRWRTYDADDFEEFTVGKRQQLAAQTSDWHWGPRSPVFSAYDTLDSVLSIGTVTESGSCYRCGGRRARPECCCTDYLARKPAPARSRRGAPASAERADAPQLVRSGLDLHDEHQHD